MRRLFRLTPAALIVLYLVPSIACGQAETVPPAAGQFVVTREPVKDGVRATADLPTSQHHRNSGGNDRTPSNPRGEPGKGYGLCVYTSFWHCAIWQSVTEVYGFRDWMQHMPGGSYPEKFEATLNQFCREKGIPIPSYIQHTGGDEEFLELAIRTGRAVGVTYCGVDGPGRYGSEVVAHMVTLVHFDKRDACILDNNFPGTFLWMSRADFLCRHRGIQSNGKPFMARDGSRLAPVGGGWSIVLLQSPPAPYPAPPSRQFGNGACVCGGSCKCKPGECPARCPVLVGQCQGGQCALPGVQVSPSAAPPADPDGPTNPLQLPTATAPPGLKEPYPDPKAHPGQFVWKWVPGLGNRWIQFDTGEDWGKLPDGKWGWVPRAKAPPTEAPARVATEPFPTNGVETSRVNTEKRFWCNGAACTASEVAAALSLTDDSQRWNLSIVGEPSFLRRVKDDVAALPADVRSKLHVQTYTPEGWEPKQFALPLGVSLRRPAVNRIGADLGGISVGSYTAAKMADLLTVPGGPNPKPPTVPDPMPPAKPEPPRVPNVEPVKPTPQPDPQPNNTGLVLLILGAFAAVYVMTRHR